ncbi:uncharacterized protein LOC128740763, partial [Sabethes cyaneus]|uniref:uncharacterized protein LOC128740763 n=1 Tax=Sabethes cyaneus TaxID=53552 RepID=UPI00237D3B7F
ANVNKTSERKRNDYLDWNEYFMATAFLAAKRSKDPNTQVGACIVNEEKKIVGVGYNGFPIGCDDDEFPWTKASGDPLENKYLYVCHAEMNAILNKNSADVKNCTIYVALFPCNECAKMIIQSRIREIVYMSDKHSHKDATIASKRMLDAAGVKYWQYVPKSNNILIDFTEIDWDNLKQLKLSMADKDVITNAIQRKPHQGKRNDYLDWNEYFMATAFLAAKRSKDPNTQVGACIVNEEKKIVGVGYNGFPIGCDDDEFPWSKVSGDPLENKYLYVCHAEMNAILNKNSADVKNCTIYVALFPCNECAKMIIQSRIREIVYMSDKHSHKDATIASKRMLDAAGVKYWQYVPKSSNILIDFTEIDWDNLNQLPATPAKKQ